MKENRLPRTLLAMSQWTIRKLLGCFCLFKQSWQKQVASNDFVLFNLALVTSGRQISVGGVNAFEMESGF